MPPVAATGVLRAVAAVPPLRVVVVDDDAAFRVLLGEVLAAGGVHVVGTASDGAAGIELVSSLRPDAVTMDLEMPGMNGVEATRAIACADDAPPVVIVSGSASSELVDEAIAAGAVALISKSRIGAELVPALHDALAAAHR